MIDLDEFLPPIAVWEAVEGEPDKLISLLRGDGELSRPVRDALADWIEGRLTPVEIPPGHAPPDFWAVIRRIEIYQNYGGHEVRTEMGLAGWYYDRLRRFIRSKGWHRGESRWSEKLRDRIAVRYGIDPLAFANYMARARPKPAVPEWSELRQRKEIAREIRRKLTGENG